MTTFKRKKCAVNWKPLENQFCSQQLKQVLRGYKPKTLPFEKDHPELLSSSNKNKILIFNSEGIQMNVARMVTHVFRAEKSIHLLGMCYC